MINKKSNGLLVFWALSLLLTTRELFNFHETGCVHTFRSAMVCDSSAAIVHLVIGILSIAGILRALWVGAKNLTK